MSVAEHREEQALRHLKVSGVNPTFGFEPCEDPGCVVSWSGIASSCRRLACPSCGCSGTNLSTIQLSRLLPGGERLDCSACGHGWIQGATPGYVLTLAETAECTCPDACERDHGND
jgi:hypothetical protein